MHNTDGNFSAQITQAIHNFLLCMASGLKSEVYQKGLSLKRIAVTNLTLIQTQVRVYFVISC